LLLALRVVESRKDSESLAGLEPCLQS